MAYNCDHSTTYYILGTGSIYLGVIKSKGRNLYKYCSYRTIFCKYLSVCIHNLNCTNMRKKFFLVLVAVGLIFFLSLEADAKKAVSKEGRKEKTGNQLVVEKERMTKMKTMNENGYDKNSAGYGDNKCVDED